MLSEILKAAKDDKLMTNQQLAEAANLPTDTVNKILAGTTKNPTLDTLRRLAKALDISGDTLLELPELAEIVREADVPDRDAPPQPPDVTALYERMIGTYSSALEDARREKRRWFWVSLALAALLLLELIVDIAL